MDPAREDRIYELQQALAGMTAEEWDEFLDSTCADDHELRDEVLRRLRAIDSVSPSRPPAAFVLIPTPQLIHHALEDGAPSNVFRPPNVAPRFEIRRKLGSGGFGVVYEAFDIERGRRVALKTLYQADSNDLYRLKREFRSLADVRHRNLVSLYELFVSREVSFFTMELVCGGDFLSRTRASLERGDRAGTRQLIGQLVDGVHALHESRKLHGDLKPSNVLVDDEDRVVILDFGIASELASQSGHQRSQLAGTPMYMAPELLRRDAALEASDWYSVGVILYEVLVGSPPFGGDIWSILRQKVESVTPDLKSLADSPESELAELCRGLLRPEPSARPTYHQITACLGARARSSGEGGDRFRTAFIGRERELRLLHEELGHVMKGKASLVCVEGISGIGKTSLVKQFSADAARGCGAIVLAGRCYERESVPYKALDSAIDALSQYLRQLPDGELAAVLPRYIDPLVRMFSVLGRVDLGRQSSRAIDETLSPHDERRRALAALRELLARVSDRHPLILTIDDAQWGDAESAALVAALLRPPDAPRVLVLLSFRSEEGSTSQLLHALWRELADDDVKVTRLSVAELTPAAADRLALGLTQDAAIAAAIAKEASGNPFLIRVLARYAASDPRRDLASGLNLKDVVRRMVAALPAEARGVMETLSIAARPLDPRLAGAAVGEPDPWPIVEMLRAGDMVKSVASPTGGMIEIFHDRIREVVDDSIAVGRRSDLHRFLAEAMESSESGDAETIASHYHAAGDPARASAHALRAAEEAMQSYAFDRAARLFGNVIEWSAGDTRAVHVRLGDALAWAGRGARAADAYMRAAGESGARERLELQRRAAEQLLTSGNIARGLDAVQTLLQSLHLRLPSSSFVALGSLILRRALVRMRGLKFTEKDEESVPEGDRILIDACWSVAIGLSMVDTIRATDFQARHLLLALRAGEPFRVARALALEIGHRGLAGSRVEADVLRLVQRTQDLSDRLGRPYPRALVEMTCGALAWMNGRWRACLHRSDAAERLFVESCGTPSWETTTARIFSLAALLWMGDFTEHRRRMLPLVREARERGNLYAAVSLPLLGYAHLTTLADDEPEQASATVERLSEAWVTERFDLQRFWATYARAEIHLYNGDGVLAWDTVNAATLEVRRSLLLRGQSMRISWFSLKARCALAAVKCGRPRAMRDAEACIARLSKEQAPWAGALAVSLRSAVEAYRGRRETAAKLLTRAEAEFDATDMRLHAASANLAFGQLMGTSPMVHIGAPSAFATEGVRDPVRLAAVLIPGPW